MNSRSGESPRRGFKHDLPVLFSVAALILGVDAVAMESGHARHHHHDRQSQDNLPMADESRLSGPTLEKFSLPFSDRPFRLAADPFDSYQIVVTTIDLPETVEPAPPQPGAVDG